MQAGRLINKIVIESVTETRSSTGAVTRTWATFATVWASKREPRGREFFAGGAQQAETTVVFAIRWLAGVTTKMRITFDGKVYDIKAITDPDDRRTELHLACVEGVNLG